MAQVKQKHGIIERENYNKPKSEKSRQPGCPEEKVKAMGKSYFDNSSYNVAFESYHNPGSVMKSEKRMCQKAS